MSGNSRRWGTALAAGLVAAAVVTGCSTSPKTAALTSLEKTNLTVAAVPVTSAAGLYLAQQQGFFAAAGLKVHIVSITSSSTVIGEQLAGKYDITEGGYVSYILAAAQHHADLQFLAEGSLATPGSQPILVHSRSKITTIAQLRGHKIAVNALNNIGAILVESALEDNGISPSSVTLVPIPFPAMAKALSKHTVDAAYMPEPYATEAEEQIAAEPIYDTDSGATQNFPIGGYVVTRSWEQKYPHAAAAFRQALEKGQALADADPVRTSLAMQSFLHVNSSAAAIMAVNNYPLSTSGIRLQRVVNAMERFGLLKQPYNIAAMLDGTGS
jgi:NitT/TauT family transport system substrate-binding protein